MPVVQRVAIGSPSKSAFRFGFDRRLHDPREFSLVFSSRLVIRNGKHFPFVLHYRFSSASQLSRLGLVIPKRYARSAVLRNTLKRQAREAFRLVMVKLPACDLVLRLDRTLPVIDDKPLPEQRKVWRGMIEMLLLSVANLSRNPDNQ